MFCIYFISLLQSRKILILLLSYTRSFGLKLGVRVTLYKQYIYNIQQVPIHKLIYILVYSIVSIKCQSRTIPAFILQWKLRSHISNGQYIIWFQLNTKRVIKLLQLSLIIINKIEIIFYLIKKLTCKKV